MMEKEKGKWLGLSRSCRKWKLYGEKIDASLAKDKTLSADVRTIMAVSCCATQHVLKCKMETMNLFNYLFRGLFFSAGATFGKLPGCTESSALSGSL